MSDVAVAALPSEVRNIFLISDNTSLVQHLTSLLPAACDLHISPSVSSLLDEEQPAITLILIDCSSSRWTDTLHKLEELQKNAQETTVALLNVPEKQSLKQALKWPVLRGIFTTDMGADLLLKGLDELLEGRYWFSRSQMNQMASFRQAPRTPAPKIAEALSPREMEVLDLTSQGKSNADIAKTLFLSQHTVKTHLYNLYKKIGVVNRTQAVHWYQENH